VHHISFDKPWFQADDSKDYGQTADRIPEPTIGELYGERCPQYRPPAIGTPKTKRGRDGAQSQIQAHGVDQPENLRNLNSLRREQCRVDEREVCDACFAVLL
jgi:hypothetical protein